VITRFTTYYIQLNAATEIPKWKKSVRIMAEEDGIWDGKTFHYISGQQKEIYLISSAKNNLGEQPKTTF
jgi:hypothetical protein